MKYLLALVLLQVALGSWSVSPATASEPFPTGPERRVLGGHRFQPVEGITDPFVTTHLRTLTGAGVATGLQAPFFDTDGDTLGTLDGDIAFFSLQFSYQLNLFERYALSLKLSGTGRAGIDEQALLADGLTSVYGLEFGARGVIWRNEESQLTGLLSVSRKNLFGLDPFGFAQRVIDAGGLTEDNKLLREGDINRFGAGVAGAHGFSPSLGMVAYLLGGSAQPVADSEAREGYFRGGVSVDYDLLPAQGFPLGFSLAYGYDSFPEGGSDVAKGINSGTLGINYTGREDFHFGFELTAASFKQTDIRNTLASTSGLVSLQYYF